METADLVLMPWVEARRRLGAREHALRVLRVRENGALPLDVLCGYERYRRP